MKGQRIGEGMIQTEAFDIPPKPSKTKRRVATVPPEPGTWGATKEDARKAGRALGRLFGSAFREGMQRGLNPDYRWRDPATGRFITKKKRG